MLRFHPVVWGLALGLGCSSQESQPGQIPDGAELDEGPAVAGGAKSNSRSVHPLLSFDPGVIENGEMDAVQKPRCTTPIKSFTWMSGELVEKSEERQILSVNGYMSDTELLLDMMWSRDKLQKNWSGLEEGASLSNWRDLLEAPLAPNGTRLAGSISTTLTVVHTDDCSRSGVPSQSEPWIALNALILSQVESTDSESVESDSEVPVRSQVVLALEQAPSIKSVKLHCQSGWTSRIGVRDGRARFTDVPEEECQAGWIGDVHGWVLIPAEAELLRCIFEADSVSCDPL